ncbi:uncharacterized protein CIMG_00478 [Coccidioides immitis RS]|uniref:Uncharacterized protein n=1 Tax=Coccidioides immitis (strain RS) TaxID=246410 RepID=J3KH31_COCIM|nr:uncharacterized protein CIMG_00478 [Coccidioides immitis RS]EAS35124.3 hypothetical protein CIMG_00478 [Coccidioides immitis RS]
MKIQERQVGSGSVIDKLSDIQMRKVTEGGGSSDADGACLWTTSSRLLQMVTTKVKSALTPRNNWTPESCAPMGGVARLKTALSIWFAPKLRGKYEYVVQHGKATIGLVRSMRSNGDVPYGGWNVCSCRVGGIDGLECIWTAKRGKAITLETKPWEGIARIILCIIDHGGPLMFLPAPRPEYHCIPCVRKTMIEMPGSDEFHGYRSHQPVDRKADTRTWASPHNRMYFPAVLMWRRKIARIQASTRIEQGSQRLLLRRRPENAKGVSRLKGPSASGLGPPYGNNEQDGGFSISDAEYLVTKYGVLCMVTVVLPRIGTNSEVFLGPGTWWAGRDIKMYHSIRSTPLSFTAGSKRVEAAGFRIAAVCCQTRLAIGVQGLRLVSLSHWTRRRISSREPYGRGVIDRLENCTSSRLELLRGKTGLIPLTPLQTRRPSFFLHAPSNQSADDVGFVLCCRPAGLDKQVKSPVLALFPPLGGLSPLSKRKSNVCGWEVRLSSFSLRRELWNSFLRKPTKPDHKIARSASRRATSQATAVIRLI